MEQNETDHQQKYYKEIEACIQLENLSYFIRRQDSRISSLKSGYRGLSLPTLVWGILFFYGIMLYANGLNSETSIMVIIAITISTICLIYNKFHDNKIRKQVNEIEAERDEKQNLYNEWYSYIDSAFQKGEFSITKDCWHSGNELLKYYNDNRAFSFKEALYYVEKRRDREAMENGLRNAYSAGYSSGSSDGYNSGYNNGYNSGYHTGKRK